MFLPCTDQEYISWWSSKIAVCSVNSQTLQPIACEDYDPRDWKECEWSLGFEGEGELLGWSVLAKAPAVDACQQPVSQKASAGVQCGGPGLLAAEEE
jgi:hypothetical protein